MTLLITYVTFKSILPVHHGTITGHPSSIRLNARLQNRYLLLLYAALTQYGQ